MLRAEPTSRPQQDGGPRGWPLFLPALLLLGGCGGTAGPELPPLAPVKGKVVVDGQALNGGRVALVPLTAQSSPVASGGNVDAGGNYEIFTEGKAGAPLGKYKVVVTPSMVPPDPTGKSPMKISFDKKYGDQAKSPLRIEVVNSPAAGAYDLKLGK